MRGWRVQTGVSLSLDTVGEFVWAVGKAGFPLPRSSALARLRPIGRLPEFANSIIIGTGTYAKPYQALWSEAAGSPRPCDNDGVRALEPARFPAKTPSHEWGIPAITVILTGVVGRVFGGESRPGRGVLKSN